MRRRGCFAHKSINCLDFEILIVFALSNLTIAVKFFTERKGKKKIISFQLRFATFWLHYICVCSHAFDCLTENFLLNVIYCITCTLCKKIYIGETGGRLADRFREHLRDVEKNNTDTSKPVARHFNLPNHSHHNMTICGLSLHHGNTERRKSLEQNSFFNLVHSLHTELINASHSTNLFTNSRDHISTNGKALLHSHINHNTPQFLYSL